MPKESTDAARGEPKHKESNRPKHDIEHAHVKAAEHHDRAAKHHRAAVEAHRQGAPEKAAAHAAAAMGEWHHALKYTTEASKHYADIIQ